MLRIFMEAGCGNFEKQEIEIFARKSEILTRKREIQIATSRAVISLFRVIYSIFPIQAFASIPRHFAFPT